MTNLLKTDVTFVWEKSEEEAFTQLKEKIITPPILAFPHFERPFILQTDASDYAIGAVVSQKDTANVEHPIAYISRTLKKTERNYSVTEKECLALVYACQIFRPLLFGRELEVITDHAPLQWLQTHKDSSSRLI